MSEQRLIDANRMNPFDICNKSCIDGVATLSGWVALQPTIDPETLPIVRELREKLARYEKAEQEGRLVEIPCKVGDSIYVIPSEVNYELNKLSHPENNRIYKQTVSGIRMYHSNEYLVETCEGFCTVLASYFKNTWFLTREEAEDALKERE